MAEKKQKRLNNEPSQALTRQLPRRGSFKGNLESNF